MPEPATRRKRAGQFIGGGRSIIIMRSTGQVIVHAQVLDKEFRIDTVDLGTLKLRPSQIQSIVYKNPPTYATDVVRTVGGTEINGTVTNDPVHVRADDLGGGKTIPKAKILSIVF